MAEVEQLTFEFEKRKVIKGYPELVWTGKRPYKSTQYFPAQLKETYGKSKDGWMNKIFWGDNLQVMSHLLKEYRGKIDLIYIDPPFDSKADYKKKIALKGKTVFNDSTTFEEKQYGDIWTNDEYLQFMYERLILLKELLSTSGTIYLHCDWHKSHLLRMVMDEVFGADNFRNEIVWHYKTYQGQVSSYFPRKHDTLLMYSKTSQYFFKLLKDDDPEKTIDFTRWNAYLNENNEITGGNYPKQDSRFDGYYKRFVKENHRNPGVNDVILKIEGNTIDSVWELKAIDPKNATERIGYPTQKPESLLERVLEASSKPGDIVFDCFMGSGTTQAVAMKLGRKFIGADINLGAIQTTTKRLIGIANNINSQLGNEDKFAGFEIYNVNNYDFFRNPVEARDLLLEALEINAFPASSVFDGEKDGRMVKLMPVNRIATKADLAELIANLPYKTYERRKEENPTQPVERISIVCMGHEPDLKAAFEQQVSAYKIDVEIVDILRDKADLQFKREAEATIKIEGNKVVIKNFYPLNLMQKLSLQKDSVDNWKQLVESIMIDFNYDGAVLSPTVIDIPEKDGLVKGEYPVPSGAGTIRVKITDVLSESLEVEVK